MVLEMMVTEVVTAAVVVETSVAATKKILHEAFDFAFLDVDVTDGKTFEVAQILERKHVAFAFISGSPQEQLPSDLRSVSFIPKRCYPAQIERVLQARLTDPSSSSHATAAPFTAMAAAPARSCAHRHRLR